MYIDVLISICITLLALTGLAITIVGLPGPWMLVAIGAVMTFYFSDSRLPAMSIFAFACIVGIAGLGELIEFVAGAAGVKKTGGSRRAAALAIVGSIVGAIVGLFVGTPVPVIGSVVVSLLLGGLGAFTGAVLGERWKGRVWDDSIAVGKAAFWGRLAGTLGKVICAATIMSVVIGAAWLSNS